jgi:putative copper export protein
VRFSVVATVALVAVGVAGIALAAIILDAPSDLWATEWGRTLIAKTLLVAAAAAAGGYNHAVVIPRLEAAPDNPAVVGHFRSVIAAEAVLLVAVVVVTGLLMGASST